jgi:hypothetical protein
MYMTVSMATSMWRPTPLMEPIPEGCQLKKSATFHSFGESQRFCGNGESAGHVANGEASMNRSANDNDQNRQEHSTKSFVNWLSRLSLRRRGRNQRQNGFSMKNSVSLCKFGLVTD